MWEGERLGGCRVDPGQVGLHQVLPFSHNHILEHISITFPSPVVKVCQVNTLWFGELHKMFKLMQSGGRNDKFDAVVRFPLS